MTAIEWKPVKGFPYEVSNYGEVRRASPQRNTYVGRLLKLYTDKDGYKLVRLSKNGITYDKKVHTLVCEAWHGDKPSSKHQVRHFPDHDKSNNTPGNLIWGTALDNANDRLLHGHQHKGEKHPKAVFTQAQVDLIRKAHKIAKKGRQRVPKGFINTLCTLYNTNPHTIHSIIAGKGYSKS
jgi:hypothetical protein